MNPDVCPKSFCLTPPGVEWKDQDDQVLYMAFLNGRWIRLTEDEHVVWQVIGS